MRRAVPLLATVLLAGAIENVAGQEIEIVASAGTVVLKVTIEPQDTFYALAKQELDYFARQLWEPRVTAVDALVNRMVEESFNGGKISDEDNKKAVQLRRDWAKDVDNILQALPEDSKVTFSVEFPDSPETTELQKHGDWPTVKKKLVGADDKMLMLLQYRRRLTDALLSVAWLKMRQDSPRARDTRMDFWETEPVGSVTRTSDLDVTTVGNNCAAAVKYFNDFYRRGFCAESGVVLDSNVYCEIYKVHDWVPSNIKEVRDSDDENPACQDAMALAKLRRYATEAEWDKFAKSTSHVPTVARADSFFEYYEQQLQLQQASTISSGAQCTAGSKIQLTGNAVTENAEMAAANELYAGRLERLRKLLWANAIADRLKFEQSAANLFANESYNSQGPLLHVLGIVQGKRTDLIDIITKEQLLNSVNEQIGDALKDLTHYQQVNPNNIGEALYKTSKYVDRALQAVWIMEAKDGSIDEPRQGNDERSPTELEKLLQKPAYDVEEQLRIRAGADGDELVYRHDGETGPGRIFEIRRDYQYSKLTAAQKAAAAIASAPGIGNYQQFRDKLITAAIDINLRARPGADTPAPQRCDFELQ